jgi:uncharacterized protein YgbK (DUF1537 family)
VSLGHDGLLKAVREEEKKGNKIIIFDAVSRKDLMNIVEVGFSMKDIPLFVGSAGLAEEVAKKISQQNGKPKPVLQKEFKSFKHLFIISGSASSITHQQLKKIREKNVPEFLIDQYLLLLDETKIKFEKEELSKKIANSLSHKAAILKVTPERLIHQDSTGIPIHIKIPKVIASIALSAIEKAKLDPNDLVLILTGGDTAMSLINLLRPEGIEIEGEILEGIMKGHLIGGPLSGLSLVTKAGAFGKENALENIVEILEKGISSSV